jgi:hypothetical protein
MQRTREESATAVYRISSNSWRSTGGARVLSRAKEEREGNETGRAKAECKSSVGKTTNMPAPAMSLSRLLQLDDDDDSAAVVTVAAAAAMPFFSLLCVFCSCFVRPVGVECGLLGVTAGPALGAGGGTR